MADITSRSEDIIFGAIFGVNADSRARKQEMLSEFTVTGIFRNEYHVFDTIARNHTKVTITAGFLSLWLRTNRAAIENSQWVEIEKYKVTPDVEPFAEFCNSVVTLHGELSKMNVSDEEYATALEMYKMEYLSTAGIEILETGAEILSGSVKVGRKQLSGYKDAMGYVKGSLVQLDNITSKNDRRGMVIYGVNEPEEDESDGRVKLISTYGIDELDEALGGIYEGEMISVLAPAKGGKSRFSTAVLHNAIVNFGVPVVMWSIENGYKGWECLLRARHFNYFYNSQQTDVTQKRFINDDMIRKGEMSKEMREMELASWTDLKNNSHYGRILNLDEDFKAESFMEILDKSVQAIGAKLVCIDYLQLLTSSSSGYGDKKNERIGNAYIELLQYLKKRKIGGIFPGQFKQSVVGDLAKSDEADLINKEMRDAAGETYEIIKTPDVNLGLYGTIEDIRNGHIKIISIPSRNHAPFQPIDCYCDMGSCTFASIRKES